MNITFRTQINQSYDIVADAFNEKLFRHLLPPSIIAGLLRFDGSKPGDMVHIRFHLPWPADWISRITEERRNDREYTFVDIGEKLPYGIKSWKHIHTVRKAGNKTTTIIDDMNFSTDNALLDRLIYPVMYSAFLPRKRLYKSYFEKPE